MAQPSIRGGFTEFSRRNRDIDNNSVLTNSHKSGTLVLGAGGLAIAEVLDEDSMVSDSATSLATQQSIKAYVDAVGGTLFIKGTATWTLGLATASPITANVIEVDGLENITNVVQFASDTFSVESDAITTSSNLQVTYHSDGAGVPFLVSVFNRGVGSCVVKMTNTASVANLSGAAADRIFINVT